MSIRTTVTLDEDVFENLKLVAKQRGVSFKEALNEVTRVGLTVTQVPAREEPYIVKPLKLIPNPGIDFSCISELLAEEDELLFQEKQRKLRAHLDNS